MSKRLRNSSFNYRKYWYEDEYINFKHPRIILKIHFVLLYFLAQLCQAHFYPERLYRNSAFDSFDLLFCRIQTIFYQFPGKLVPQSCPTEWWLHRIRPKLLLDRHLHTFTVRIEFQMVLGFLSSRELLDDESVFLRL